MAYKYPPVEFTKGLDSTDFVTLEGSSDPVALESTLTDSWETGDYSDITLYVRGVKIKAHKLMLVSYCHELKDKISTESDQQELILDQDPLHVINVLRFVYYKTVIVRKDEVMELSKVAMAMGEYSMAEKCIQAQLASSIIGVDNCFDLISIANGIGDDDFAEKAMRFALEHFSAIQKTTQFKKLSFDTLEDYLCHSDLNVRSPEERFGAGLFWAKDDPAVRMQEFIRIIDLLPIKMMKKWYLDQVLLDPVIQDYPEIGIELEHSQRILSDFDRHKADICAAHVTSQKRERCLILVNTCFPGKASNEVVALRMENEFEAVSLGQLGKRSSFGETTSCCVLDGWLYVCGFRSKSREIWRFNLEQHTSEMCGKLNIGRTHTTMGVGSDGKIFILGGWKLSLIGFAKYILNKPLQVEALDISSMKCSKVGELRYPSGGTLACHCTDDGHNFLVFGGSSTTKCYIQVFDTQKGSTNRIIRFISGTEDYQDMYAVIRDKDNLIALSSLFTLVCKTKDILAGQDDRLFLCKNYVVPNEWCVATKSMDGGSILLFGGVPKKGNPLVFVYEAKFVDILKDSKQGWQPSNIPWKHGPCRLYGGCVVADITINE